MLPAKTHLDPLDVFRDHLNPEIQSSLTEVQNQRMAEYRFILGYITSGHTQLQTVRSLLAAPYHLTEGTAYRRIQETFRIYGDYTRAEKDAKRIIYIEHLEKTFFDATNDARNTDDPKEKIALFSVADSAMKHLIKLQELDKTTNLNKSGKVTRQITNVVFLQNAPAPIPQPEDTTYEAL